MIPWYDSETDYHRNEILLLVEVMYAQHIALCDHLTNVGFDLIDICDVTRGWIEPIFTNHNNVDVLFTLIINIPGSLNNRKFIVDVCKKAHTLYQLDDYGFFHRHRATKSWKKCLQVP